MYKQKWNQLVDLHSENLLSQETIIQNLWEIAFAELFGYSRLRGELDSHRTIRIGSFDRVIPDIIIKENNTDLFIVELKQHNKYFDSGMERQLFSYLKQLKMSTGILICNKLYIYNYDINKSDNAQNKMEIAFEKDNADGIKFLEYFSKGNFKNSIVNNLIKEKMEREKTTKEVESKLTNDYVLELIKKDLTSTYKDVNVEQVLKNYSLSITKKPTPTYQAPTRVTPNISTTPIYNTNLNLEQTPNTISKRIAILLFAKNNINVVGETTFASLNKSAQTYWANPRISILNQNWSLILNDCKRKKLHLFYIPANTLSLEKLKIRHDKPDFIDIQINYYSSSFTDIRSGINFLNYFKQTIDY